MIRRVLLALAVAAAVAAAVVLTGAAEPDTSGKRYRIVFDNVFGLVEGGDAKIGGVTAGEVKGFELTGDEPKKVAVEVEINRPGLASLREDAQCGVRQQSLIGEYFVDCKLGTGDPLPDGGEVPVEQTFSTIPIDLVSNVMRRPYRERFRLIIGELGTGLAGRPEDLNEVIRRAHPGLRETSQTFHILADQNREIARFIENSDRVGEEVAPRRDDLSRWALEASETAEIQASREESLSEQWRNFPIFLSELRPTLAQLQDTATRQIPLLEQLERTAPELRQFLASLAPFADAARASNRELSKTAAVGRQALDEAADEVHELAALAPDAPRLAKPLRQFLQAIDDRERSTEDDPAAAELAPPKPDKTAYEPGQGLTGMEAVWNYIYNQTLAINIFDEVSHLLRITLIRNDCSPHFANPDETDIRKCSSFLGPYQPGLEAAKGEIGGRDYGPADRDPTDVRASTAARRDERRGEGRRAKRGDSPPKRAETEPRRARRPGAGEPDAEKPDPVKESVDRVKRIGREARERVPDPVDRPEPADTLLDFLLGP